MVHLYDKRAVAAIERMGCTTPEDVSKYPASAFEGKNCGWSTINRIRRWLESNGYSFADESLRQKSPKVMGVELRDIFAAAALAAGLGGGQTYPDAADTCYLLADCMMERRKQAPKAKG